MGQLSWITPGVPLQGYKDFLIAEYEYGAMTKQKAVDLPSLITYYVVLQAFKILFNNS